MYVLWNIMKRFTIRHTTNLGIEEIHSHSGQKKSAYINLNLTIRIISIDHLIQYCECNMEHHILLVIS